MLVFFFFFLRQAFSKKSLAWNPLGRTGCHNLSKINAFIGYKNERKRPTGRYQRFPRPLSRMKKEDKGHCCVELCGKDVMCAWG